MAISITFNEYLASHDISYEVVKHRPTTNSLDSCSSAHLPTEQVAKAVVLKDAEGEFLVASLGVGHRLSIDQVNKLTGKDYQLVNEVQLRELFPDCAQGAIPGIGEAYEFDMLVDDALLGAKQVYLEAGDHRHLVKLDHRQFSDLLASKPHGNISGAVIGTPKWAEHLSSEWTLS